MKLPLRDSANNMSAQEPGLVWYSSNKGGSIFTPRSIASGLEAHIAAGKVGFDLSGSVQILMYLPLSMDIVFDANFCIKLHEVDYLSI